MEASNQILLALWHVAMLVHVHFFFQVCLYYIVHRVSMHTLTDMLPPSFLACPGCNSVHRAKLRSQEQQKSLEALVDFQT